MWDNRDVYNGLSVLPYDGGTYKQPPFEDCSKETYEAMLNTLSEVDLTQVKENDDNTQTCLANWLVPVELARFF